jgi:hypothetical protein
MVILEKQKTKTTLLSILFRLNYLVCLPSFNLESSKGCFYSMEKLGDQFKVVFASFVTGMFLFGLLAVAEP